MDKEETDVTLVAAATGVLGLVVGFMIAKHWRKSKLEKELNARLEKATMMNTLQMEMNQWMVDNMETMDQNEFWTQLNERAQYMHMVAHEA